MDYNIQIPIFKIGAVYISSKRKNFFYLGVKIPIVGKKKLSYAKMGCLVLSDNYLIPIKFFIKHLESTVKTGFYENKTNNKTYKVDLDRLDEISFYRIKKNSSSLVTKIEQLTKQ